MEAPSPKTLHSLQTWLGTGAINIFGLPFAGKDTHATELAKMFATKTVSGGDILRNEPDFEHIRHIMDQGYLAPTDEFIAGILPYMAQPKFTGKPLILSSLGRWHGEETAVVDVATRSGHPIKAVLYLIVDQKEAYRRWQLAERGRADDAAEHVLETRFVEFANKTLPVIDFYRRHKLLIEIDAMPSQEVVTRDIITKLLTFSKK